MQSKQNMFSRLKTDQMEPGRKLFVHWEGGNRWMHAQRSMPVTERFHSTDMYSYVQAHWQCCQGKAKQLYVVM